MSTLTAVVNLDLLTVRPYRTQLLVLIGGGAAVALLMRNPAAVLPMAAVYATLLASYPFAVGDKADLTTLAGTLPVRRTTLVVGRYASALLGFAACQVVGLALALGLAVATGSGAPGPELAVLAAVSFALFALIAGIQLPLYFALGYARARLLGFLPFFLVFAAIGALSSVLAGADPTAQPPALAAPILVGVGGALLALSCVVAVRLYERRQL